MKKVFLLAMSVFLTITWNSNAQEVNNLSSLPLGLDNGKLVGYWSFNDNVNLYEAKNTGASALTPSGDPIYQLIDEVGTLRMDYAATGKYLQLTNHGIPNGDDYCIMMDIKIDKEIGSGAQITSLFRGSDSGDGYYFVGFDNSNTRKNAIGYGEYESNCLNPGGWNRIIINVRSTEDKARLYVIHPDGTIKMNLRTSKRTLNENGIIQFFGDDDGENGRLNVSQIALFNKSLSFYELAKLGAHEVLPADAPKLSNDTETYWYYIQSSRANGDGENIVLLDERDENARLKFQTQKAEEDGSALWKVTGGITEYTISSLYENSFWANNTNGDAQIYARQTKTPFTIEAYGTEEDGYIQSKITGTNANYLNVNNTKDQRYLNTWNSPWGFNDGGAPISFVLAPEEVYSDQTNVDFGIYGLGVSSVNRTIKITGVNLKSQNTVSYSIAGANKSSFSATEISWDTKQGGELEIEFTPNGAGIYNAALELSYTDGATKTIPLIAEITASPILYVDETMVDFGNIALDMTSDETTISISGVALEGDITYQLTGTDNNLFNITETSWTATEGGILSITFAPTTKGEKNATLEITSLNATSLSIPLKGFGEDIVKLSTEDNSNETWYYIKSARGNGYYTDMKAGKDLQTITVAYKDYSGQLWKLVGKNSSKFRLISKEGNQITYGSNNHYQTAASSSHEYALKNSTYEYVGHEDVFVLHDLATSNQNLDKSNTGNFFGRWHTTHEDGTAIVFVLPSEVITEEAPFSTEVEDKWFTIGFDNRTGFVIQDNGPGEKVTQTELENNIPKTNQLFKFVGNFAEMKIISKEGNAIRVRPNTENRVETNEISLANNLNFEYANGKMVIKNSEKPASGGTREYLNNHNTGEVMQWTATDVGSYLKITRYIPDATWIGKEDTNWNNAANWSGGVPAEYTDVVLTAGKNVPSVPAETTIGGLTVKDGAKANLVGTLTVNGKVTVEKAVNKYIWYPIGFPFSAKAHWAGYGEESELIPFVNEETSADFWLKEYLGENGVFQYINPSSDYPMLMGKGYIIQYPENSHNKTITYISEGSEPVKFTNEALVITGDYKLLANPSLGDYNLPEVNKTYYYILNSAGTVFERNTSGTLKPFESVIAVSNPSVLRSSIYPDGEYTSVENILNEEEYGKIKDIRYYNFQGIEIAEPQNSGVYIVKIIYESGLKITSKIFNTKK